MAQNPINIGAVANDGTGDSLRVAGDKINDNTTELYTYNHFRGSWAGTTALPVDADNLGSDTDGDILAGNYWIFTNTVSFGGSVFPPKSVAMAIQNSPTTLAHWTILAPQS